MTFSLVARCPNSGMFGVIVASSSPAVAARCAFAKAGIGAMATQNVTDPSLGPRGLKLLRAEADALEVIDTLCDSADHMEYRQLLVVDRYGGTASHSGAKLLGLGTEASIPNAVAGGNMLADIGVPHAMITSFAAISETGADIGECLITALEAGRDAGGEAGPVHSAGMLIVDKVSWPVADLRIDWTENDPVAELAALWERYKPMMDDYVTRALDPTSAPSYGVPGDE
jgi:uncharacterized Ntn-hydrolase superfamily protein